MVRRDGRSRKHALSRRAVRAASSSRLRPDLAPGHVARIKELTRHGFYDGLTFHRVIEGFMAQTGDPAATAPAARARSSRPSSTTANFVRGTVGDGARQRSGQRRQPILHLLRAGAVPRRQIHDLGPGDLGHGSSIDAIKRATKAQNGSVTDPDKIVKMQVAADAERPISDSGGRPAISAVTAFLRRLAFAVYREPRLVAIAADGVLERACRWR